MSARLRLVIGSDDAGFEYKEALKADLEASDRVVRPANTSRNTPGRGLAVVPTKNGSRIGVINVLGSINDGLGNGPDQLFLKAALDGFAAIAFAASLGWGVAASAIAILVVQGSLTLLGAALGDVLPDPHLAALTTTGGLMLVGVALRLPRLKQLPVGDLLPALLMAPLLTQLVIALR